MTIVIECVLESAVFFPGDTLFCRVYVSNRSQLQQQLQGTSKEHSISWISAQIYGNMSVEPKYFKLNSPKQKKKNATKRIVVGGGSGMMGSSSSSSSSHIGISSATSLPNITDTGDNGRSLFASPTTILTSDLNLSSGQTKSFIYYVTLPSPLPPSFKGTSIRYSYFLSIAAQLFTHPARILTIPIRILTPASSLRQLKFKSNITNQFDYEEGSTETPQETSKGLEIISKWPVSPFKKSQYFPVPYPQTVSQYDSNNTRKSVIDLLNKCSNPVSIIISKGSEKLVTFSISRTAFKLGDTVCGAFDFSIATIPCYKILVKLECEETIEPKYQQESKIKPNRRLYGELHEYTTNIRQTHFMFHIPVEAAQEFSTKHVAVRWILRFEFVTPVKNPLKELQVPPPQLTRSNSMTTFQPTSPTKLLPRNASSQQFLDTSGSLSKANSYSDDIIAKQHSTTTTTTTTTTALATSQSSTPPHTSKNRVIAEVPSDSESNLSSDSFNEETLSSSGSVRSTPATTTTTTSSTNINHNNNGTRVNRGENNPVIGALKSIDDTSIQTVDTLRWSLPIRVLVCESPHELLHTHKNELIL
ncbi:E set domain-containing protein [Cavenderia fasciculata]|uniref:E set domain-containing protein n=1 Tax=Cavenderia fasciculata TaxID=261658 RepID=F4PHX6_CACFS|nr:E set domain-containing protein [Cavenderia fasciculata]EGG25310.1 E set domain-containing protein [Cavenderia fasciculata]|eukprot:XP_004363161.1 E set domain-containing protein [Cavenderia fasciculata]